MTCVFDTRAERKAVNPRKSVKTSLKLTNGFYFFSKEMRATSFKDRMEAYLSRRGHIASLMLADINNLVPGRSFLPLFVEDLKTLLHDDNHLTQLAIRVTQQLHPYVTLTCNILLYLCDQTFCPEHTPKVALETCRREDGGEIIDLISRVELLVLRLYKLEGKPRSYIYETLGVSNPQVIYDTHQYCIDSLRRSPQPWSKEVSDEVEQLCLSAREQARTVAPEQRASLLMLQNIVFTGKVIGTDRQRSIAYAQQKAKSGAGEQRSSQSEAFVRPKLKNRPPGLAARANAATYDRSSQPEEEGSVNGDWEESSSRPRANSAQTNRPLVQSGRPVLKPSDRATPGRPDPRELLYRGSYVDFEAVFKAAESDNPRLRQLAISLWPSGCCTKIEPGPLPKPSPVLGADGNIKRHANGEVVLGYQEAKSCRYCGVFAANPRNNVDTSKWGPPAQVEAFKRGQHNPRTCSRSQLAAMMAGPIGLTLLKESKYK